MENDPDIGQKSCPYLYDYGWFVNEYLAMQNDGKLFYQFLEDKEDQRYKEMYDEYYQEEHHSDGYAYNISDEVVMAGRSSKGKGLCLCLS